MVHSIRIFPNTNKESSIRILIPRIGEERARGYSLTEGGYYFAVNDYFDLLIREYLCKWIMDGNSTNLLIRIYINMMEIFPLAMQIIFRDIRDCRIIAKQQTTGWAGLITGPKASPGSRFSASVNMSSSGYDRSKSYTVADHVTTQRQSSVSYSKSWAGTPFNFAMSMNHSQNVKNKTVSLNLPKD